MTLISLKSNLSLYPGLLSTRKLLPSFTLMTTWAFSQNVGKLFSELKLVTDILCRSQLRSHWKKLRVEYEQSVDVCSINAVLSLLLRTQSLTCLVVTGVSLPPSGQGFIIRTPNVSACSDSECLYPAVIQWWGAWVFETMYQHQSSLEFVIAKSEPSGVRC